MLHAHFARWVRAHADPDSIHLTLPPSPLAGSKNENKISFSYFVVYVVCLAACMV